MKKSTASLAVVEVPADLLESLSPRVEASAAMCDLRALRERAAVRRSAYAGGLMAERQAAVQLRRLDRSARRSIVMGRRGRKIDLIPLLQMRRKGGEPLWAIADPIRELDTYNGFSDTEMDRRITKSQANSCYDNVTIRVDAPNKSGTAFTPAGLPALPPRVREMLTDPQVRRRARFVSVLYQPDTWRQVDPDPAVVVEWLDRPGEYYALAVWGGDRAQLMEWID